MSNRAIGPAPVYSDAELAPLGPEALIELMIRDEDRVPRNVIDACARQGEAMVEWLEQILLNDRAWSDIETRGEWWLLLHAVMILGLITGERAAQVLVKSMRRLSEEEDEGPEDWIAAYWPALLRNKPASVLPAVRALAEDRDVDWFMRVQAIDGTAALMQRESDLEAALDWAANIVADENEDWDTRLSTGNLLLDFPRDRYRALLDGLAAQQSGWGVMFAADDVRKSYVAMQDRPEWDRFDNPWKFYDPHEIEKRRARWEEEDRRAAERGDGPEDEFDGALHEAAGDDFVIEHPYVRTAPKTGRNDPCHCGSGKKYKKCCLQQDQTMI